jgi:predicted ATP-grasp superfamily ATP-dependent carboligase
MKLFRVLVGLAILSGSMISISNALPKYATKEGKKCVYCHVKMGSKDLNDTGKCYQANDHSLAKCKAPAGS